MEFGKAVELVTALSDRERALSIGRDAVESRLAACSQLGGPIRSTYEWKGRIEQEEEWVLILKTLPGTSSALADFVRSRHPYETPEILLREVDVSTAYLAWMAGNLDEGVRGPRPRDATPSSP